MIRMWIPSICLLFCLSGSLAGPQQTHRESAYGGPRRKTTASTRVQSTTSSCWPKESFALIQPTTGCPDNQWGTGSITNTLYRNSTLPAGDLINGTIDGAYMTMNFCAHNREQGCSNGTAPNHFPKGSYCIYEYEQARTRQHIEAHCPAGFLFSWIAIDDLNLRNMNAHNGEVPLAEYFSTSTVPYFCCREDGDPEKAIALPVEKDFIMFPTMVKGTCQKVRGMAVKKEQIFYSISDDDSAVNSAPAAPDEPPPEYMIDNPKNFWGQGLRLSICYYSKTGRSRANVRRRLAAAPKPTPVCWPKEDFVLFQPSSGCPTDGIWTPGFVTHQLGPQSELPDVLAGEMSEDGSLTLGFCKHHAAEQAQKKTCTSRNTAQFPPGSYCVFHGYIGLSDIFDKSCPVGFTYDWVVIDNTDVVRKNNNNGTIPEGEYYDYSDVYYTCCRDDGNVNTSISLPTREPFVLLPTATDRKCQSVVGMMVQYLDIFMDTGDKNSIPMEPSPPYLSNDLTIMSTVPGKWGPGMHFKICYYTVA